MHIYKSSVIEGGVENLAALSRQHTAKGAKENAVSECVRQNKWAARLKNEVCIPLW